MRPHSHIQNRGHSSLQCKHGMCPHAPNTYSKQPDTCMAIRVDVDLAVTIEKGSDRLFPYQRSPL